MHDVHSFQKIVQKHYKENGRDLPWRQTTDPYQIVVSEVMLQQTQVDRVVKKYAEFVAHFPDFSSLAAASVGDVLRAWQGLGYNRRGLMLKQLAETVVEKYSSTLPNDPALLEELPGIGPATAQSICAFAFNVPVVFIETNIRTVFIHHFFKNRNKEKKVSDDELLPLVEKTLDKKNPRQWYNALMDYGTFLKKEFGNANVRSAQYARQSKFEGSNRQVRGRILKVLSTGALRRADLIKNVGLAPEKIRKNLIQLHSEGFLREERGIVSLA
ncbi:MAG: A/G-specific adenine glycosylase [Candidatus Woesearchaeota archaeon]|nr:A/G-specific adenine glycosylase [Candidatus Woesearchaeota archaeon]